MLTKQINDTPLGSFSFLNVIPLFPGIILARYIFLIVVPTLKMILGAVLPLSNLLSLTPRFFHTL